MPMLGYVNGVCVGHEFREGNASPGAGIVGLAQDCEAALPEGKGIYFRSDSAAYQAAVINRYSQAGRSFTITADQDAAVKREIQNLGEKAWTPYRTPDLTGRSHSDLAVDAGARERTSFDLTRGMFVERIVYRKLTGESILV
jgi:hypothetical protein